MTRSYASFAPEKVQIRGFLATSLQVKEALSLLNGSNDIPYCSCLEKKKSRNKGRYDRQSVGPEKGERYRVSRVIVTHLPGSVQVDRS